MKIEYINYFLEVCKVKSISNAAQRLFISQQGLSKAIQSLESEFDVVLFNRAAPHVSLTGEGQVFAEYAQQIWDTYAELKASMADASAEPPKNNKPNLRIHSTAFLLNFFFPLVYDKICEYGNFSNIVFSEKTPLEILVELPDVENETLCMTNVPNYMMPNILSRSDIHFVHIFDAVLMARVSVYSELAYRKIFTLQDIVRQQFAIYYDSMLVEMLGHMFGGTNKINIAFKTTNRNLIKQKIMTSNAVGFTDSFLTRLYPDKDMVSIPIQDSITMHHGLIFHNANPPSKKIMDMIKTIKKHYVKIIG